MINKKHLKSLATILVLFLPSLSLAGTGGASLETTATQIYNMVTGWGGKIAMGLFFGHALIRLVSSGEVKTMVIAVLIPIVVLFLFPALYNSVSAII